MVPASVVADLAGPVDRLIGSPRGVRVLAVSPHLDDAVLSAGGLLSQLIRGGAEVDVVTLFAGIPHGELSGTARHIHDLCGYDPDGSPVVQRRAEDVAALTRLMARVWHADFCDAIYRRTSDGSWLCRPGRDMFHPGLAAEPGLTAGLVAYLGGLATAVRPEVVLTCAAIGDHVDHRLARDAGIRLGQDLGGLTLAWEDLPYAVGRPPAPAPGKHRPIPWPVDDASWAAKLAAVGQYRSQLRLLWPDGGWQADLEAHARARDERQPVELVWVLPVTTTGPGVHPERPTDSRRSHD